MKQWIKPRWLYLQKIEQKHSAEPGRFDTLQSIVLYEVENRQNHLSQSATIALLWLKRFVSGGLSLSLSVK